MIFWLGTHEPHWLERTDVPLFISARRLRKVKRSLRARGPWALDSGGFTELSLHGEWTVSALRYALEAQRWQAQIGRMAWAAQQDWMCEPLILAKTGLTVQQHQGRTVANYLDLRALAPDVPWAPVIQGWEHADYLRHVELWRAAGVDLESLPIVGLGSVCRRQATGMAEELIRDLAGIGIKLHGFGFKLQGLRRVAGQLASSDSMAWSFDARRTDPLPGHTHRSCANCLEYALRWREKAMRAAGPPGRSRQLSFLFGGP